jgi:hypothetical protein
MTTVDIERLRAQITADVTASVLAALGIHQRHQ